ncbi:hypothetical protein GJU40_11655 [Bacillus lacus]|uniref:Uncharacterized protein n=1 Tax=Metabacillus lacus TaxID=1983721 RepID=A0A7X2LYW8_9BACI|nr:GH32 C-terminal domain-containing protein [Metabacillus lacus]MRX72801.1 hypothetical protein [Metabacillus lacus]
MKKLLILVLSFFLVISSLEFSFSDKRVQAAETITNPSFETGDLSGWSVVSGNAFSPADVASENEYWSKTPFNQSNLWHIWGGRGNDSKVGVMESETFTLGGDGKINVLTGGNKDLSNLYVALVRESDGQELLKATGSGSETFAKVELNAAAYVGTVVKFKVVDKSNSGHINVDDFNVPPTPSLHGHTEPALYNHDFEYTSLTPNQIKGWKVISGDAFTPESLVREKHAGKGDSFGHMGSKHLWSFKDGGDAQTGEIKSENFTVGGNGGIDFLVSGGEDLEKLYVALVRESDGKELFQTTGGNSERYQRVFWDASPYVGQVVSIRVIDKATGEFGHINADDFHVLNSKFGGGIFGQWSLNEGSGKVTKDQTTGLSNQINYHLSKGAYQIAKDPLWRQDGISGSALLFDGYSTWLERSPSETPSPDSFMTIEGWVAPRNFEHGDEGRISAIISQHNREEKTGYVLGNYRHGTWGLQFGTGKEWREVMSDGVLPLNEWSYIAATFDSVKGEVILYLNGEKVASENFPIGEKIKKSNEKLMIGKNNQGMWLYGFTMNMYSGLLDELKLRNNVLTPGEIKNQYNTYLQALGGNLPTPDMRMDRSLLANDKHRPQFHPSPPNHWGNEPGGPIYFNGQYHMFYQSNPRGPFWNHIRWGHLISEDMVRWRDAEDPVIPGRQDTDPDGAWAGGAVVDDTNTPVIFYTAGDDRDSPNQRINIARSQFPKDGDNDLNKWEKNQGVVLEQKAGEGVRGEFRDPFVFKDGDIWFMLVTSGKEDAGGNPIGGTALVYSTKDPSFKDWQFKGDLFVGDSNTYPLTGRVWELPILLPLGNTGKYIFLINPAKMERDEFQSRYTWYWIGTWDREKAKFTPDTMKPELLDVGDHFTGPAGLITPDGRTVIHSITQGRRTAMQDYDAGFAHNYGLPTEVFLKSNGKLGIKPLNELASLRGNQLLNINSDTTFTEANQQLGNVKGDMFEVELVLDQGSANEAGLSVKRSPRGEEETTVFYKRSSREFFVDRTKSSLNPDVEKWYQGGIADIGNENITLRLFVDRSEINAYLNETKALTTRAYPERNDSTGLRLWANANAETVKVKSLKIWEMKSAYPKVSTTGAALKPSSLQLKAGDTERLTPVISPSNAANKDVIWKSSNPSIAEVVNGKVKGKAKGTAIISIKTRDGQFSASSTVTVVPEPVHGSLVNHDFETGDLSGWTIESGDAFSALDVTARTDWGWGGPFNQHESYHLFGLDEGTDSQTGVLRSHLFKLGGNGQIDFLLSGGNDIYNLYVALVRASDGKEVLKATGGNREGYQRIHWDASEYIGIEFYIKVVDKASGGWGHINVDDVNVPVEPPPKTSIANPDFETGTLEGWTVVGDAFKQADVVKDEGWSWECCFEQNKQYHLWGFKDGGDAQTGELKSETFTLSGSGWIDFLIGGGKNIDQLYVALVRSSDDKELMKATGRNEEKYSRVYWNASQFAGEQVYIKVVDRAEGGFGHLNLDDFNVHNKDEDLFTKSSYTELRPKFHYTSERNWLNDPNGLVYFEGEYHMFYQHNPTGTSWGPMHWGHAVSRDLVNWKRLPMAIESDNNGFIWSGSVVVDYNNTAGFGTNTMIALYTQEKGGNQVQSMAVSNNKGRTWKKVGDNPVLTNGDNLPVFRDPKVFWHAQTNKWIMLLAAENSQREQFVKIYTSLNLKNWTFASDFGKADGSHGGVWEVPDLFELPVEGSPGLKKWVMAVSLSEGMPAGGSGVQYFVGTFDGVTFKNENSPGTILYADYGADNYAPLTFNHIPESDGRRILIGWMNNWRYGQGTPASIWRSGMTVPRELKLVNVPNQGIRLSQTPVKELNSLRGQAQTWSNQTIQSGGPNLLSNVKGTALEMIVEFDAGTATAEEFGLKVRKGKNTFTSIAYNHKLKSLIVDRTKSGETSFAEGFGAKHTVSMQPVEGKIGLRLLIDQTSVEVFANDGQVVMTDQIFPYPNSDGLELYSTNGSVKVTSLTVYPMKGASYTK